MIDSFEINAMVSPLTPNSCHEPRPRSSRETDKKHWGGAVRQVVRGCFWPSAANSNSLAAPECKFAQTAKPITLLQVHQVFGLEYVGVKIFVCEHSSGHVQEDWGILGQVALRLLNPNMTNKTGAAPGPADGSRWAGPQTWSSALGCNSMPQYMRYSLYSLYPPL